MKNTILASLAFAALGLTACAPARNAEIPKIPKDQQVLRAPMSADETGMIVSGMPKSTLESMVAKNSKLSVRVINPKHGLYEIFGSTEDDIQNNVKGMNVLVEPNSYVPFQDESQEIAKKWAKLNDDTSNKKAEPAKNLLVQAIEKNQGVTLTGDDLAFVNTCKLNSLVAPDIKVTDNQGRDRQDTWIYFDLGQQVTLDASQSKQKSTGAPVTYQWLVTAPDDSLLKPTFSHDAQITYKPDTTGLHIFSVVVKDQLGFCNVEMRPFYVTANDKFAPGPAYNPSLSAKINPQTFWHVFHVGAVDGWKKATGKGITIAIIDSGVNYNHPALSPNIRINTGEIPDNKIDDDNNGFIDDIVGYDFGQDDPYPFDDFGHGSHVAGIAASQLFGAARQAKILPIKATLIGGFDVATVVGAVEYAVDSGAKVINMSFGWTEDYPVMRQAMDYAEQHGVLIAIAAGNDTANNDSTANYPANYKNKNILTVAASDENDKLTFYSNFGPNSVEIAAPGGTPTKPIISAYKKNPHNANFVPLMGTSMATPLVAGVAAQVWSADPNLTVTQLKQILLETAKPSADLKGKITSGAVIDAKAAVEKAARMNQLTTAPSGLL